MVCYSTGGCGFMTEYVRLILLAFLTLFILIFPPMYLMGKLMQYLERRKIIKEEVES